jgi:hypothetical protein
MPRIKLPRRLARLIARYAAETGMSLDKAANYCLLLAAVRPRPDGFAWIGGRFVLFECKFLGGNN